MVNKIVIGDVKEEFYDSPINMLKKAMFLVALYYVKGEEFLVHSNNPQFIEALETLCLEGDVKIYFETFHCPSQFKEISFKQAYDYLGGVYHIINHIKFEQMWVRDYDELDYESIQESIKEYEDKWSDFE